MSTYLLPTCIRFLLLFFSILQLANCASLYPFGASKNGQYFGGQGNAATPRAFVPRDIQREEPIFNHHAASGKKQTVISYP
jgi:hypothetical protein